jgi:hypothetical protein
MLTARRRRLFLDAGPGTSNEVLSDSDHNVVEELLILGVIGPSKTLSIRSFIPYLPGVLQWRWRHSPNRGP